MAESKPEPPPRSATTTTAATATSSTSNTTSALPPPSAAARQRLSQRVNSAKEPSPSPRPDSSSRRRSSLISYSSIEDLRQSFTDDIINPRTKRQRSTQDDSEPSHWHSSPLAFAILPAIGGLLFQNGSAFVTDVLLLGLAAIFMNWSIRLPWDWYFSAQALRRDVQPDVDADIVEDETAVDTASEAGSPGPSSDRRRDTVADTDRPVQHVDDKRDEAASDLRRQEVLALGATFVFPVLAAYLLHVIRAQLSGPSTSLVSDYNLSIFLLAAEIRPVRHLVKLIANRTLHLQRTVTGIDDPFSSALEEKSTITKLADRITDLESKLLENTVVPQTMSMAQKADISDLSVEIRKRYEPRLEGLERAVRRYEKRSTTMAIATESRLQNLEERLQDALNLAAVAAKYSQNRGLVATTLQTTSTLIAFPMKVGLEIAVWPIRVIDDLYIRLKTLLIGPIPQRSSAKRRSGKSSAYDGGSRDEKPRDKISRKIIR